MAARWQIKPIRLTTSIKGPIQAGWNVAMAELAGWIQNDLLRAMIYGGLGLQGIAQTPLYQWITSPDGLSQLGIQPTEPLKLLEAYRSSFKISVRSGGLYFEFGNVAALIRGTPHPASGTGKLRIKSWMKWITDEDGNPGEIVSDAGYVPRDHLPPRSQRFIRLNSPLGGLMLPNGKIGSTGSWRAGNGNKINDYADKWFLQNSSRLESLIIEKMGEFLVKALLHV